MRKLVAVAAAGALVAGLSLAASLPAAAEDCERFSLDAADIYTTPVTSIGVQAEKTVEITAVVHDPCDQVDAAVVRIDSPAFGETLDLEKVVVEGYGADYQAYGLDLVLDPAQLYNSDAGTWTAAITVHDDASAPDVVVAGPDFRVLRAAKLSANASPEPVTKGKTVTVTGSLDRASWESGTYGNYGGKKLDLQYKSRGGSYAKLKTVTANSLGDVRTTVKATRDGYYRFVYAGNGTTPAVKSAGDYVDVK